MKLYVSKTNFNRKLAALTTRVNYMEGTVQGTEGSKLERKLFQKNFFSWNLIVE